ncbi:unnamed protein product [Fraxinus pennsylvanica]|uniref:Uncharacterized protein n=1 Tax=Fraxinus pennsylvanica TaxID=56036 RepID=A0AAD1ZAU7_9LAMI|nr:unnamed protein product [Fraxinus pennsylvanica]
MEVDSTHAFTPYDLNSLLSCTSMNHSEFRSHEMLEEVKMTVNGQELDESLSAGDPASFPTRCSLSAVMRVQKVYRSYRTRRMLADSAVVAEVLWWQAIDYARLNHSTVSFFNFMKPETAASRWNRVSLNASKVKNMISSCN